MENRACCTCQKPKANFKCGICQIPVCKNCVLYLEDDAFSFLAEIPPDLAHKTYCPSCFDQKVSPEMHCYNEIMERAKLVTVFFIDQGKATRLMNRNEKTIQVKDCNDKRDTLMRLAFFAAKANFNALIDADITAVKKRINSYQTSVWHGSATPLNLNEAQLRYK